MYLLLEHTHTPIKLRFIPNYLPLMTVVEGCVVGGGGIGKMMSGLQLGLT